MNQLNSRKQAPMRTPDQPLFVSTDPAKLHAPSFAGDPAIMRGICGCRIPALLGASLPDGGHLLLAAADVGNEGADWGSLGLAFRRSRDHGSTWEKPRQIFRLQAHHAPQGFDDWASPFAIDPVLMQAQDGSILAVIDLWPESKGFGKSGWLEQKTGYEQVGGRRYLALYDTPSFVGTEGGEAVPESAAYTVREHGWIYDPPGTRTRYYLPQHHDATMAFITYGDLYYAVGEPDYLHCPPPLIPPPPDGRRDVYVGNILMSCDKPAFDRDRPVFVQKRRAGPGGREAGYDAPSDYEILETEPAPLRCAVTSFLLLLRSVDGGESWGQPEDVSIHIKRESDGPFLGVGPGLGLRLSCQADSKKNGRLLLPLYNATDRDLRAKAAYSDDNGRTWRMSAEGWVQNRDEIQFVELLDGTVLSLGRRGGSWSEGAGPTPVSQSLDGGESWTEQPPTPLLSVRCQKSFLSYPYDDGLNPDSPFAYPAGMIPGRQYLLAAHPTGLSGIPNCLRTDGAISLGEVQEDHSVRWIRRRLVMLPEQYAAADEEKWRRFFAYSCLSVLEDGTIGLLYEPQPNNYIAYFRFSLEWLLEAGENGEA